MAESIDKLREEAKEKFSDEEINKFIQMGKIFACKTVLTCLQQTINEVPVRGREKERDRILQRVGECITVTYSGYEAISITGMDIKLHICLSICPKDYRTEIDVPPDDKFIKDLYTQYGFLRNIANAYWKQFCEENPDLTRRICDYCNDLDMSTMIIDPTHHTTMYWDANCSKRVGIFCYYVDKNGRPFEKVRK